MSADEERTDEIIASFPAGVLGDHSARLSLLHNDVDFFVVAKPAAVSVRQHPWEPGANLDRAFNDALQQGKPWASQLNCEVIGSVFPLEQAVSGPVLFAKNASALAKARNAFGSYTFLFRYLLIVNESEKVVGEAEILCEMPLRADASLAKMHPSRRRGKRCETRFKRLQTGHNGWSLWQAETTYPRMHQIRAHAQIVGLTIAGDSVYGKERVPTAKELRSSGSGPGLLKPLLSGLGVHLQSLSLPALSDGSAPLAIDCPPPDDFTNCLRKAGWE
jgi:23S rRNA-/tRNA-specific pseudouridylate synthase